MVDYNKNSINQKLNLRLSTNNWEYHCTAFAVIGMYEYGTQDRIGITAAKKAKFNRILYNLSYLVMIHKCWSYFLSGSLRSAFLGFILWKLGKSGIFFGIQWIHPNLILFFEIDRLFSLIFAFPCL